MIIDDNIDASDSLAELLNLLGYEAVAAHEGQIGLAIAAEIHPDVVLLDLGMPRMDGYEVARQLRRPDRAPCRAVVALTGWNDALTKERVIEAGFDSHLTKPVAIDTLLKMLQEVS